MKEYLLCMMATSAHLRNGSAKTKYFSVERELQNGNFIVQRSTHKFCRLTLDHSHEQSNKCIKGEGVIVGLTENCCSLELNYGMA